MKKQIFYCVMVLVFNLSIKPMFARAAVSLHPSWSGKEHLTLGDLGSAQACAELKIQPDKCPTTGIFRRDHKVAFTYGELVTAGDFYDIPQNLIDDTKFGVIKMLKCVRDGLKNSSPEKCKLKFLLNKPSYLIVVRHNYHHFGWNNMVAYVRFHGAALLKARASFDKNRSRQLRNELFQEALVLNGFADHYLTDAFASGHIRVPRLQIKKWATSGGLSGSSKEFRADTLAMVLHDTESRNLKSGDEQGFPVQNSRGDKWRTRGDDHLTDQLKQLGTRDQEFKNGLLNQLDLMNDPTSLLPFLAVKASFMDLLRAKETGTLPDGTYAAALMVPYSQDVSLVEKLSPEFQKMGQRDIVDRLYSVYPLIERILFRKSDFYIMLDHLKDIFSIFQSDVNRELSENSEIQRRLPIEYIEAYQHLE